MKRIDVTTQLMVLIMVLGGLAMTEAAHAQFLIACCMPDGTCQEGHTPETCANAGGANAGANCLFANCGCAGNCGGPAPACWCDSLCHTFGDCCNDVCLHCTGPNCTCQFNCGGNSGPFPNCWCDAACFNFNDCCLDVCDHCLGSFPEQCSPCIGNTCATAEPINEGATDNNGIAGCTNSGTSDSCSTAAPGRDRWFAYTPSCNGIASASVCVSDDVFLTGDVALSVFDGCPAQGGVELACSNDHPNVFCISSPSARVSWPVTAGETYFVRLTGDGTFVTVTFECEPTICGFLSPKLLSTATGPHSLGIAHFTHSSFPDLVVTHNASTRAYLNINNAFYLLSAISTGSHWQVAVGNVNGSTLDDYVYTAPNLNNITVVQSTIVDFMHEWEFWQSPPLSINPHAIALGDLNGNGLDDIATADREPSGSTVAVLLSNGDGTFGQETLHFTGVNTRVESIAIGDVTGNGLNDIVTANDWTGNVSILPGTGGGTFGSLIQQSIGPPPTWGPFGVATGDLNGNGNSDIVTANGSANTISILLSNGGGSFAPPQVIPVGTHPTSVAVGDLNGDGLLDIVVANRDSDTVSVLLGFGNGTFTSPKSFAAGNSPRDVAIGDMNNNGRTDVLVAAHGSDAVTFLFQCSIPPGFSGTKGLIVPEMGMLGLFAMDVTYSAGSIMDGPLSFGLDELPETVTASFVIDVFEGIGTTPGLQAGLDNLVSFSLTLGDATWTELEEFDVQFALVAPEPGEENWSVLIQDVQFKSTPLNNDQIVSNSPLKFTGTDPVTGQSFEYVYTRSVPSIAPSSCEEIGCCEGHCGGASPVGCACDADCFARGDCCSDVCATCALAACPAACLGDLSGPDGAPDGIVDVFDLIALINEWGPCANPSNCPADLSGPAGEPDGTVDVFDLIQLINNWGPCSP